VFDGLIFFGLVVYLTSLSVALWMLGMNRRFQFIRGSLRNRVLPVCFLLVVALYILPLSIRSIFTQSVDGMISPQIALFVDYIPICLVMCAYFNITFAIFYRINPVRVRTDNAPPAARMSIHEQVVFLVFLLVSLWMLSRLGARVGGIVNLILLGYTVTELFVNAGHFAIAFDWLTALTVYLLFSALISKSKIQLCLSLAMLSSLATVFFLMGRRGALLVLLGAVLYACHVAHKRLSLARFAGMLALIFFLLNFIGLIRGASYDNVDSIVPVLAEQNKRLEDGNPGMFYALTTGNFAVPFETMPQVVRTAGDEYMFGFGAYSLRSLLMLIPGVIWPDRPDGLSNWYAATFYGVTKQNEGRQFFFLSEAFMNFGPFGMILWGALTALIIRRVERLSVRGDKDPIIGMLVATFIASMLNFVANDLVGFHIAFLKGFGLPVIALLIARRISRKSHVGSYENRIHHGIVPVWRG